MRFEEKLKNRSSQQIWQEYCGFLDLDLDGYMNIQNRLMAEQVSLWKASKLGRKIMEKNGIKEEDLETVDDFRKLFPVTTYDDYADILLQKNGDMLPADPVDMDPDHMGGRHASDKSRTLHQEHAGYIQAKRHGLHDTGSMR